MTTTANHPPAPRRRRATDAPKPTAAVLCIDDQRAADVLGVSVSTFYVLQREDPDFPQPIHLLPGNRVKRWPVAVLERYVATKAREAQAR